MKIVKPRFGLLFGFVAISVVICAFLLYFATPAISYGYYANWAIVVTLIAFLVSPWGAQRFDENNVATLRYSFWPWWLRIVALELSLLLVYLGIANLCGQQLLIHTSKQPQLFLQSLFYLNIHLGLLPWAAIALLTTGMGYTSYRRNQDAHMSVVLYPLLKSDSAKALGLILDSTTRMATHIALATTLAMMMLLFLSLITTKNITVVHGFTPAAVSATLLLLLISFTHIYKRYLNKALSRNIPLFISIPLLCILSALLLLFIGILIEGISQGIKVDIPHIIKHLQQYGWRMSWHIFAASWWLAWVPVCSAFIAYYSRGRSIRELIIGVLALPLLLCMGLGLSHHFAWQGFTLSNTIITLIALVGFFGLLILIGNHQQLSMVIMSYLPKRGPFKHRDHYFFFRKNFQLAIGVLYVFLPGGITVTYAILFMLTLPFCLILLVTIPGIIKLVSSDAIHAQKES